MVHGYWFLYLWKTVKSMNVLPSSFSLAKTLDYILKLATKVCDLIWPLPLMPDYTTPRSRYQNTRDQQSKFII